MQALIRQTATVLEMIKFQHTIFALPFALASMLIAANGIPALNIVIWIILACVFARTAAMSFNRWADQHIDGRNPRTAIRAIPAGLLNARFVLLFALGSAIAFMGCAAMLNPLAFLLSPLALLILFGYSYAKRFTPLAHLILGLALAIAPVGAWVAVRQEIGLTSVLLALGVLTWTAGFDLIYACQDIDVDKKEGLFSIPSRYGVRFTINLSRFFHAMAITCFTFAGAASELGWFYFAGVFVAGLLLIAEQWVVDPHDTHKINLAFFTINSWVGMAILAGTALDILNQY